MGFSQSQAAMAGKNRGATYKAIVSLFSYLPDKDFDQRVFSKSYMDMISKYKDIGQSQITKGCILIEKASQRHISYEEIETMAVERTSLLRAPYDKGLKPPYQSLYIDKDGKEGLLVQLRRSYIEAGYIPAKGSDAMDFILVQLDFMKNLVLSSEGQLLDRFRKEKAFIENHLSWVKSYVEQALNYSESDFYKGWLLFLAGFLQLEKDFLDNIDEI